MALDHAQLERLLCERLCANVRVHRRHDDVLMLESPFTFPDGDHYPIYLSETPGGGVKLSDRGHTLMHVSYEHDVDSFYEGARASLRERIVRESGIDEEEGVFSMEAPPDHVAAALFRFGQALTKIHDLTFLSRDRLASTFYDDLRGLLFTMLDEDNVDTDYIPPDVPNATAYPVDYHFPGSDGRPVFLYGVPGRDKARLTTIMLSHFLLHGLTFESVIVFADQQEIPRLDLARLTNVAGTAAASLSMQNRIFAERLNDLRRELIHVRTSLSGAMPGHRTPHHSDKCRVCLLRRRHRRQHGNRPPAVRDSHRLRVAIHLLDNERNQPQAHRHLVDPDIVLRGDRGIDETRVPASQPIVGAATSALRSQVVSLAERDELGCRLAFRELKRLGRGLAVQ